MYLQTVVDPHTSYPYLIGASGCIQFCGISCMIYGGPTLLQASLWGPEFLSHGETHMLDCLLHEVKEHDVVCSHKLNFVQEQDFKRFDKT